MFGLSSQEGHFGFFICVQIEDCGIQSYSEQNIPLIKGTLRIKGPDPQKADRDMQELDDFGASWRASNP